MLYYMVVKASVSSALFQFQNVSIYNKCIITKANINMSKANNGMPIFLLWYMIIGNFKLYLKVYFTACSEKIERKM